MKKAKIKKECDMKKAMTRSQKEAANIYGICCVCAEQVYCPYKGAGKEKCDHDQFAPSQFYHVKRVNHHG